jgi:putative ABC transport system ATP-binding protein
VTEAAVPLEARDLELTRGGVKVLRSVSLRCPKGAVTVVVGPSGSGKSSLLRCLNRLEEPESGRVLLDGVDVRTLDAPSLRRRVGMIFQTPSLFSESVHDDLVYGLEGVPAGDLDAALDAAGLPTSFLERRSTALSVGQAQRVTIARALVRHPEVLLMDEPTSALDRDAAARIERLVTSLAGRGLAIVLVTHDLAQARRLATHAVVLVEGSVAASGDPSAIDKVWPTKETS